MLLRNLKIGTRLAVGFGAVLLVMVVVAVRPSEKENLIVLIVAPTLPLVSLS